MKKRKLIFTVVALLLISIFILLLTWLWNSSSREKVGDTVSEESPDEEKNDIDEITDNDINEISGNDAGELTRETKDEGTSAASLSESVFSDTEKKSGDKT